MNSNRKIKLLGVPFLITIALKHIFAFFSESFLNKENVEKMTSFAKSTQERHCHCIRGSVHQNHIDAPFVLQVTILHITRAALKVTLAWASADFFPGEGKKF
jgi:hypothetical protein